MEKEIGKFITKLRIENMLSIKELAKHTKITKRKLKRIENGTYGYNIEELFNLSNILGCTLDEIVSAKRNPNKKEINIACHAILKHFEKREKYLRIRTFILFIVLLIIMIILFLYIINNFI